MKVVNAGSTYRIYDNSIHVGETLEPQSYVVRFGEMSGFFLEKYSDVKITEDKIYGVHMEKVEKVLTSFSKFERSLGVILSGDKGIGKSLFAKLLAKAAIERGIPLIIVDSYIPGIASYIESIEQEVMVLFDEFDKTFGKDSNSGSESKQTSMLSLFDGTSTGKKLFVITCNDTYGLNNFLLNRPGRFHYHFRFDYPTPDEITTYLKDKLPKEYYGEISKVVTFSRKINLNYDCLRAIAFEISQGFPFGEAVKDLNIINIRNESYDLRLYFNDGSCAENIGYRIDLFDGEEMHYNVWMNSKRGYDFCNITFSNSSCIFDESSGNIVIPAEAIRIEWDPDDEVKNEAEKSKAAGVKCLVIKKHLPKNIHYAV